MSKMHSILSASLGIPRVSLVFIFILPSFAPTSKRWTLTLPFRLFPLLFPETIRRLMTARTMDTRPHSQFVSSLWSSSLFQQVRALLKMKQISLLTIISCSVAHLAQAVAYRTWFMCLTVVLAGLIEILGWTSRFLMAKATDSSLPFTIQ